MCSSVYFKRRKWFAAAFGLLLSFSAYSAKLSIVYPPPDSARDHRQDYKIELLELALKKSGVEFELRPASGVMPQGRALVQLASGHDVDVVWTATSKQREHDLLPIRIPLDKGLVGWRIFLINQDQQDKFAKVQTLADLRKFNGVQGHDWPDVDILRANGLPTLTDAKYEHLFKMLQFHLADYFSRSIDEIWDEEKGHPGMNLAVENSIVLQYPLAYYFFVNKKNTVLAETLERGLRLAIKDGSFERLFSKHFGKLLGKVNLTGRKRFVLNNPLLSPETPLQEKQLWFQP
jgi:hypothetical protein